MRKITVVALAFAMLALAGCKTETLDQKVAQVQAAATKTCGYLPTATAVAAILSAGNPAVTGVVAVADAICKAVVAQHNRMTTLFGWNKDNKPAECPKVNGVCVEGEWVDPNKKPKPEKQGSLGGGVNSATLDPSFHTAVTPVVLDDETAATVIEMTICSALPSQPCTVYPGK